MTCCRKATTCVATVRKDYITAGQCSPFAYQSELTLYRQHDSLYACQRQQTLCWQDDTRPYPDEGYARRLTRKISGSEVFKTPICTLFNISPDPPVRAPLSVRAPLESIKGRARTLEHRLRRVHTHRKVHTHTGLGVSPPACKQYITQWT
jgi:hypothetical protein